MELKTFIKSLREGRTYRMEYATKSGKPYIVEWDILKVCSKYIKYRQTEISYKYDGNIDEIKTMTQGDWASHEPVYIMDIFTGRWNKPFDRNHAINLIKSEFLQYDVEGVKLIENKN
jgi:hypothetical protein